MALKKDIKKFFFLDLLLNFRRIFFPQKDLPKSILLIRFDAIGDYVLFRNFIEILAKSSKYRGYKIIFLGNIVWKNISEFLDSKYVNQFIWVDKKKFQNDVRYKYKKLSELCSYNFEQVIYPTYSREYAVDKIMKVLSAKHKIGNKGNIINYRNDRIKKLGNSYYTELIETSDDTVFEFNKNKDFFEKLLDEEIAISKPVIQSSRDFRSQEQPYALLIPGAGRPHKIWAPENFARIADYLNRQYDYEIIISGSPSERGIAESVIGKSSVPINNRIEDSDLLDLMKLVQNSEIVITNETSAVHFAAAMDKKAVCISDGSYFGRFHPYPGEMTDKIVYIYPHQISENFDNFKVVFEKYSGVSNLDINSITVDKVISAIEKLIKVGGIEQKC